MNTIPYTAYKAALPSETKLGLVHLNVKDLDNQINFYTQALKLTIHQQDENGAILGDTKTPLLHLHKGNYKRYHHTSGMYHFALLYPSEEELAKAIAWLGALEYPQAPTDHGMSKTTYLKDVEGNDIELYIRTLDRGDYVSVNGIIQMKYHKDGRLTDGRDPLDLQELFSTITDETEINSPLYDMTMGHVHLYGKNLDKMTQFYTEVIGFGLGVIDPRFKMGDVGLDSVQNHVLAYNAWKDTDIEAPEDALGLRYLTITLPDAVSYDALIKRLEDASVEIINKNDDTFIKDPSNVWIKLEIA